MLTKANSTLQSFQVAVKWIFYKGVNAGTIVSVSFTLLNHLTLAVYSSFSYSLHRIVLSNRTETIYFNKRILLYTSEMKISSVAIML